MSSFQYDNLPLVSIGIPTYNRPEGLKKTIEFMVGQTYKNIEIIISDNASPQREEIKNIVESFNDHRIVLIQHDINKGVIFNFQFVLDAAKADYFMWAADDDEWHPEFIATLLQLLIENEDSVVAFCHFRLINHVTKFDDKKFSEELVNYTQSKIHIILSILNARTSCAANIMYGLFRRSTIHDRFISWYKNGRFDLHGSDTQFICDLLMHETFLLSPDVLFTSYISKDSATMSMTFGEKKSIDYLLGYIPIMSEAPISYIDKLLVLRVIITKILKVLFLYGRRQIAGFAQKKLPFVHKQIKNILNK